MSRLTAEMATWVEASDTFAQDRTGRLYVCRNGVYVPDGEAFLRARCLAFYEENNRASEWNRNAAAELIERIRIRAGRLVETPPSDVLNVANGLLDLKALKLADHSSEHRSTLQLPVRYDPQATCPRWDEFVAAVMPGCEAFLWELVGFMLVPESPIQKIILLYGKGGNGKSTLLGAITTLIGSNNVSNVTLQDLSGGDDYASAELFGKLENIFADLPARNIGDTGLLKAVTGGDEISAQFKFKDRFEFKPFAKLIFSANALPKVADNSVGFWDRVQIVPMEQLFRGPEADVAQSELLSKLRDPAELSGALNKALEGRARLNANKRFSEPARSRELKDEMRGKVGPVEQFLRDETRGASTGQVETQVLLERFNAWAQEHGYPEKTAGQFGKELANLRPKVQTARRGPRGAQRSVYKGLTLKHTA